METAFRWKLEGEAINVHDMFALASTPRANPRYSAATPS
jgi:hypothetical protein